MASKRGLRRKACGGKVRHKTAQDGLAAIAIIRRHKGYSGQMNVYRCEFCRAYHIGHTGRR